MQLGDPRGEQREHLVGEPPAPGPGPLLALGVLVVAALVVWRWMLAR